VTLYHQGMIEEYQVRDCRTGDCATFRGDDALILARAKFEAWSADRRDSTIMLIAVLEAS